MMNNAEILSCIEIEPDLPAKYSIIWLHGLGADGNDFVPVATELNTRTASAIRFIFPHAPIMPITINNGYEMRAWYDIQTFSFNDIDSEGIARSIAHIQKLIAREMDRGIACDHIFLAGFSQGAAIALTTGICYPKPLAGIIALSGYLPGKEELKEKIAACNKNIPIFLAHGTDDPILPFTLALATKTFLTELGYPVSWHSYHIPHSVCGEEIEDLRKWLDEISNKNKGDTNRE